MTIRLSILDQTPVFPGETASVAFAHTIELARLADRLGYDRFWVSEHHDSYRLAGSSPEVLISHLLAKTERIRVGSGGIMLQHYSPYKVAENFNVLSALAPGRIDLGIGRAPGGLPRSTRALRQGAGEQAALREKLTELRQYVHNRLDEGHPLSGIVAAPAVERPASLYVLGTSADSAELAAELGLPYVFALFINNDEQIARDAIDTYVRRFQPESGSRPEPIVALSVIVADTEAEANELAGDYEVVKIKLASGRTLTVGSIEQAEEFGRQSDEAYTVQTQRAQIVRGAKLSVRRQLLHLSRTLGVGEFIAVTTNVPDFEKRKRSFTLLKEAVAELDEEAGEWEQEERAAGRS